MPDRINHLAVWAAAIAYFVFGWVWFGLIFGNMWLALQQKPAMVAGGSVYAESFVLGLILAYATAMALTRRPDDQTVQQGISFAVFMGIALYATQTLNSALYEGRPFALWLIDTAYVVIGFALIGAIVGGWRKKSLAPAT
ncbi:MAG: DUF1761 domain-containing protein [Candidatus Eremiobacteraeota bacterium]|nr:DUF1761 domain-containing protein [Candidatus Eremiobacteraeota bacterium]MBV8354404.1 DUF1761 domain-containing protein [Candidatus Eremiobacteraeota bacterium]